MLYFLAAAIQSDKNDSLWHFIISFTITNTFKLFSNDKMCVQHENSFIKALLMSGMDHKS